ncbi:hypothetical protein [Halorarius halobius]|uniref:hypothetical protein n=1 Tax=Halorarius halobius TaxID=2962671 RepID=UPI0020CE15A8|nr:hypothetical protein [Halorarius halobius]
MSGRSGGEEPARRRADERVGRAGLAVDEGRLDALESDGRIRGYAPLVDHDALDARTVVVRLAVAPGDVDGVADCLRTLGGAHAVFELTGGDNLLAVCRFTDDTGREAFLAALAMDDRVQRVVADAAVRTATEGDRRGLL